MSSFLSIGIGAISGDSNQACCMQRRLAAQHAGDVVSAGAGLAPSLRRRPAP